MVIVLCIWASVAIAFASILTIVIRDAQNLKTK